MATAHPVNEIVFMMMNKNKTFIYQNVLDDLQTISLDELDKVKLLDRKDTKFVFNQNQLPSILEKIKPYYRILEIIIELF